MNNKTNIIVTLLFAASCAFVSCDDWTDVESISIKQPGIEEQNPELYTKYLENLRQYKDETLANDRIYNGADDNASVHGLIIAKRIRLVVHSILQACLTALILLG